MESVAGIPSYRLEWTQIWILEASVQPATDSAVATHKSAWKTHGAFRTNSMIQTVPSLLLKLLRQRRRYRRLSKLHLCGPLFQRKTKLLLFRSQASSGCLRWRLRFHQNSLVSVQQISILDLRLSFSMLRLECTSTDVCLFSETKGTTLSHKMVGTCPQDLKSVSTTYREKTECWTCLKVVSTSQPAFFLAAPSRKISCSMSTSGRRSLGAPTVKFKVSLREKKHWATSNELS